MGDEAVDGGIDGHGACDLAGLFQLLDLLVADVPQAQTVARRPQQRIGAAGHVLVGRFPQALLAPPSNQILLLGGDQVGTVEGEQGLALADQLAHEVHIDLLDPARDFHVDVGNLGFVWFHAPHCADGSLQGRATDFGGADSDELLLLHAQHDGAGRPVLHGFDFVGVLGHQIHPAVGGDAGLVGGVGGVHGVVPVEHPALGRQVHGGCVGHGVIVVVNGGGVLAAGPGTNLLPVGDA